MSNDSRRLGISSKSIVKEFDLVHPSGLTLRCSLNASRKTLRRAAWSPNGRLLAAAGEEPLVRIWDVADERVDRTLHLDAPAWTVAFSPDNYRLAIGKLSSEIDLWDLDTGASRSAFSLRGNRYATSVAVSPDGKFLAGGSNSGRVFLWDMESKERRHKLPGHAKAVQTLIFRPGTSTLVTASQDHNLALWDACSGEHLGWLRGHAGSVYAAAWSPDGVVLASGAADCTLRLWNPDRQEEIRRLDGHTGPVVNVSFSADGRLLASKSLDGTVRLWWHDTGRMVATLPASADDRNLFGTVAFHPSAPYLAVSAEEDTALQIWDLDVDRLWEVAQAPAPSTVRRDKVFVSYSHNDRKWLDRLRRMLAPLDRSGLISLWDDTQIRAGAKWKKEIKAALSAARVAVLLVSDHFLASKFIAEDELPPLLAAAEQEGVTILWVYVSACLYEETPIADYQAAHPISRSLDEMNEAARKRVLVAVCQRIKEAVAGP